MNTKLQNLLTTEDVVEALRQGLPLAYERAEFESNRVRLVRNTGLGKLVVGQEVGFLRERVILGFLRSRLGVDEVHLPTPDERFVGASVAGQPLDIKTAKERNLLTAKWTADTVSADKVIEEFRFTTDMLLVRIWWGRNRDSVFYIPVEVLQEVSASVPDYLYSSTGTNNRGVKVKNAFMKEAESHSGTVRIPIDWQKTDGPFPDPIQPYVKYWNECSR